MLPAIVVAALPFLAALLYRPIATNNALRQTQENVLLVTAHPDDECMFFAPTILGLNTANLHVLSLSFGNADGIGEIRDDEFMRSLDVLGVPEGHRHIIDHPELQDSMKLKWDPQLISNMLNFYVVEHNISSILTFDRQGISGHLNHRAAFQGVYNYAQTHIPAPKVYTLITVPTSIKFVSILAPLQAKFDIYGTQLLHYLESKVAETFYAAEAKPKQVEYTMPVFVAGIDEYLTAHRAMREHWSQLVWFRWLYVSFSRYMWVNEWQEINFAPKSPNSSIK